MPGYAVESKRQPMTATGIVNPVMEWDEMPDGKRRPSDRPARDENTGMPLFEVEVFYTHANFGREYTATGLVRVGAAEPPAPAPLTPISFSELRVRVSFNKTTGGFSENWTAEAIAESSEASKPTNDSTAASASGTSSTSSGSSKSSGSSRDASTSAA
jgi:hypothetical protein